jgi:hypothetical protein
MGLVVINAHLLPHLGSNMKGKAVLQQHELTTLGQRGAGGSGSSRPE